MKVRNKGKVHPSPSSSPQPPSDDIFSVLKILPAAILLVVSVLSPQEREVLAFMVTRSLKSSDPSFPTNKKTHSHDSQHKTAAFDCDCFNCYTSYWCKWDSSSNRELIHQAIEAFEEHLNNDEQFKKTNGRSKKKEKMGRRKIAGKSPEITPVEEIEEIEREFVKVVEEDAEGMLPENEVAAPESMPEQKGLVRKVLPDIMGLLNCRIWSLWSPNV
ncbi:ATP-dependent tryptophan/phenylalanine/tyrosine adenylase [Heracleum sosnowskyi]|uniref:ATP-dependent tryptophan/phenylalanine/tyrosine adenylase n=1 Tax=Heracleum sosnowskyi TaxID=360622 RepID=A0AAD8IBZ7_9APIA|nr:ATP-dependent tryptophan/phenylalanine/tyrosine adenylase [Heracleum sosnowskyi]